MIGARAGAPILSGPRRGALAASCAVGAAVVCTLAALPFAGAAAPLAGLALFGVIGAVVIERLAGQHPHPRFGIANGITLFRAGGAAVFVALAFEPGLLAGVGAWWGLAGASLLLALDGLDGWVARRQGLVSAFGARFDLEIDALLILALAGLAARPRQGRPVGPRPRPASLRLRPRGLARPGARPPAAAVPPPPRRLRAAGGRPRRHPGAAARPAALRGPRRGGVRRARLVLRRRRRLAAAARRDGRPPQLDRPCALARHLPRPALADRAAGRALPAASSPPAILPSTSARMSATARLRSSRAGARVVALEPQRLFHAFLARGLPAAVTLLPLAAGPAPGRAALAVSRLHPTVSSLACGFAERMARRAGLRRACAGMPRRPSRSPRSTR